MSNVLIYSRGSYEGLNIDMLKNKAIIRIHNINDIKWYPNQENEKLILFFNDYKMHNLSFFQKIKGLIGMKTSYLNKIDALKIIEYIKKNKEKDFIIHCEYGRSRSVAIALFLREFLGYKITNKEENELLKYNDWVLYLLKRFY